jgi:hypothetical protein
VRKPKKPVRKPALRTLWFPNLLLRIADILVGSVRKPKKPVRKPALRKCVKPDVPVRKPALPAAVFSSMAAAVVLTWAGAPLLQ